MSLNIVFMGTPEFSLPTLQTLIKNKFNILNAYTQPPKKSKRGQKFNPSPIEKFCKENNISFKNPTNLDNEEELKIFKKLSPDIVVVVAYGQIIPKYFLNLPKFGFINIHASLLPKWRGAAPIQRSIMNLEKQSGISIMRIKETLDTGDICNSYPLDILENENAESLSNRLSLLASEKILNDIDDILENRAVFKSQEESKATYAKKILKSEGRIDWNNKAENIVGKVNGLYPNPAAWFIFKGERYKILEAKIGHNHGDHGIVLNDNLEIGCKDKSIQIISIQREGKTPKKVKEFILGSSIKKGANLNNA